jgi:hypothetical protein
MLGEGPPTLGASEFLLPIDQPHAWIWYRSAADAGEPNALARFAEKATWRYRRATLARLLARAGMMRAVADAYAKVSIDLR